MADTVIKGRSIHPLRARLVRRNSLVWVSLRSMSPRVACRRHRYRLAIGVKEKAKKPGADGDGCGADEQKCAIYKRKHSVGEHRKMVWNRIPRLLRVAISLIYEAAILKLISILLGL